MIKTPRPLLITSLLLFALIPVCRAQQDFLNITNYRVFYGWAHNYPQDWLILRRFENSGRDYLLLLNPQTLQTKVNESSFYQIREMTLVQSRNYFRTTP